MVSSDDFFNSKNDIGVLSKNVQNNGGQVQTQPNDATPRNTTNTQNWNDGDLKVTSEGAFFTPKGTAPAPGVKTSSQDETVEGRLNGILSSNSEYIKSNEAAAQRQANARGLQNSTMAATAGRKAAIESALPIAQQDASYFQQRGLQSQQGDIQKGLYETQGDISSNLSKQDYEQNMDLKQADIEWQKLDLNARMQVEYDRMSQENKDRFDATTKEISDTYLKDYLDIMVNPNFKTSADRQAALNVLNDITQQRFSVAGSIAGVELDWGGTVEAPPIAEQPSDKAPDWYTEPPAWYKSESDFSKSQLKNLGGS